MKKYYKKGNLHFEINEETKQFTEVFNNPQQWRIMYNSYEQPYDNIVAMILVQSYSEITESEFVSVKQIVLSKL